MTKPVNNESYINAEALLAFGIEPGQCDLSEWSTEDLVKFYDQFRYIAARADDFRKHFGSQVRDRLKVGDVVSVEGCPDYTVLEVTKYSLDKDVITDPEDLAYLVEQLGSNADECFSVVPTISDTKKLRKLIEAINLVEEGEFTPDGILKKQYTELRVKKQKKVKKK